MARGRESGNKALVPTKQVGGLNWSPCSLPYVAPLAVETGDPIPGNDGV